MKLRWFLSGTVRQATDLARHVRKLLCAQRDILSPKAIQALENSLQQMNEAIRSQADKETLKKQMVVLEKSANEWLKPHPHAGLRENIEVLLVAIAVAMAIRTFFLQPFKIPTGSMQPTLNGIISTNLLNAPEVKIPNLPVRIFDAIVHGTFYHEIIAEDDGEVLIIPKVKSFGITKQPIVVQYKNQPKPTVIPIWFAPEDHFRERTGVTEGKTFTKGSPILRMRETTGDHLFVDRVSYNFSHPKRGDIIVFKTHGIDKLVEIMPSADNQFYIKRLVGMPGERISIGNDRHIRINGVPLDTSKEPFAKLYGFNPKTPAMDSKYSGHTQLYEPRWALVGDSEYKIQDEHYFVCGDNTFSSLDSRYWGDFPEKNVIGKSFFVYWPISDHFGCGQQ